MSDNERQLKISEQAQREADWFVENIGKDPVMLGEIVRIKLLQFYATGGMDAIDRIEERLALKR